MPVESGFEKFLALGAESTWGTAVVPDMYFPVTSYGVTVTPTFYQTQPFCGSFFEKAPNQPNIKTLAGSVQCDLAGRFVSHGGASKSIAQHLIDWFMLSANLTTKTPTSKTAFWADVNETGGAKTHAGLRVQKWTLAGQMGGQVTLALDLVGKSETAFGAGSGAYVIDETDADDGPNHVFLMADCSFQYGGSAIGLKSFEISGERTSEVLHLNGGSDFWPSHVLMHRHKYAFKFAFLKEANTLDSLRRALVDSSVAAELTLKGRHGGTSTNTFTRAVIAVPRAEYAGHTENVSLDQLVDQQGDWLALKPYSTSKPVGFTWSTSS